MEMRHTWKSAHTPVSPKSAKRKEEFYGEIRGQKQVIPQQFCGELVESMYSALCCTRESYLEVRRITF